MSHSIKPQIDFTRVDMAYAVLTPLICVFLLALKILGHIDILPLSDVTDKVLDFWAIIHFLNGVLTSSALVYLWPKFFKKHKFLLFSIVVVIAYGWEWFEYMMECRTLGTNMNWFQSENWLNRFVDPLLVIVGGLIGQRFERAWKFVAPVVLVWLGVNIWAPDCNFVQDWLVSHLSGVCLGLIPR